jgi:hypothetical protein
MAQIRVERQRRVSPWVWVLAAVLLVVAAVVLLDQLGYIELPFRIGASASQPATLAAAFAWIRRT